MHFATLKAELREFLAAHDSPTSRLAPGAARARRGAAAAAAAPDAPHAQDGGGELVEGEGAAAAIDGAAANASSPLRRWAGALVRTYVADKLQLPLGGLTSPGRRTPTRCAGAPFCRTGRAARRAARRRASRRRR